MSSKTSLSPDQKNLIRRYLLWCYKTTREAFEKTERKATQLTADRHILKHLQGAEDAGRLEQDGKIKEFEKYITDKEKSLEEGRSTSEYVYLRNRLAAVEDVARDFLGEKILAEIKGLYEGEMTRRILEARDH